MKVLMISRPTLFTVPGGDTVQMVETAKALEKMGVTATIHTDGSTPEYDRFDLMHFFNVIRPGNLIPHVRNSRLPYVLSTIFVDYSEIERHYRGPFFSRASQLCGPDGVDYLKTLARWAKNGEHPGDPGYLWRGQKKSVESLLNGAAVLLPNSHSEYDRLKKRYRCNRPYIPVPNGVSTDFLSYPGRENAERNGVVCVGRIELIKNQLVLIRALNGTGIPLKIIGKPAPNHLKYYEACKREAGENVTFTGQLDQACVMAELSKAKVHALPSFFETTGLSSLEAAAMGCNVVITAKGDQREYFEDWAHYCLPEDLDSIRTAVENALATPVNHGFSQHIAEHFTWEKAAEATLRAYHQAIGSQVIVSNE